MVSSTPTTSGERENLVYKAKLSEQAERYDEMADFMKSVAQAGSELTNEERNLLSVAFKNAVGSRRASWRIISSVETKNRSKGSEAHAELASEYREKVENELNKICHDILGLLDSHLIKAESQAEARVFYCKMKGDYYRYISEFSADKKKKEPTEHAEEAYQAALRIAQAELSPTHPIRLGLALNYSVFFYEIMDKKAEACKMARSAFDEAIAQLDNVSEDSYRDSTLIMQLLRDNLTLWSNDGALGEEDKPEPEREPEEESAIEGGAGASAVSGSGGAPGSDALDASAKGDPYLSRPSGPN